MKILLTGANGYIGSRLLLLLAEEKHHIVALVRNRQRFVCPEPLFEKVEVIEADLLDSKTLDALPCDIDAAYYLVHSMGRRSAGFAHDEEICASNFANALSKTNAKQLIYLSGLSSSAQLSEHMTSRQHVEQILCKGSVPVTVLRAAIIIGSGSASFEIIRDLVEKLPLMVAPKWVYSRSQPIAIADLLFYLKEVLNRQECFNRVFEVAGPDILTYKEMLLQFAQIRGLKRFIIPVPVLTPYLSSLWLFFITSTNFTLARALVNSLRCDAISTDRSIDTILPHHCLDYKTAIKRAFEKLEQNAIVSSWKDAMITSELDSNLQRYMQVPQYGCLIDKQLHSYKTTQEKAVEKLWKIGGKNGWYSCDWAWRIRGLFDRLIGGVGLRRGRTHPTRLRSGDVLDFWRVLIADQQRGELLLYAEMKLPGEAWLQWKISEGLEGGCTIEQKATFRPKGLLGRLYWYALLPFHLLIFRSLSDSIGSG